MENNFDIHKWQAEFLRESNKVEELTLGGLERLEGLINRSLLQKFLNNFEEMYSDLIEEGEDFSSEDVIQFLTYQMQEFVKDNRLPK